MEIKLVRHNKEKRSLSLRMDEDAIRKMHDTLFYTIHGRGGEESVKEYTEKFVKIWNKVCENFEVNRD